MVPGVPSINVRFTEGQHELLRAEAFRRRLSLQRVIVERLFGEGGLAAPVSASDVGGLLPPAAEAGRVTAVRAGKRAAMCEHRVPAGTFCKKCGTS
jgi:hypothetical protein